MNDILTIVQPRMVLDRPRAEALYRSAVATSALPGAMAELGVYRGGSAKLMALACPKKPIFLFDTFTGLPSPTGVDLHQAGEFANGMEDVAGWMAGSEFWLVPGRFPESIPDDLDGERFALVHLDGDLYETTRDGLAWFWPRLVAGGRIVLDDWRWPNCPGVEKAVREFSGGRRWESARYQLIIEKVA